MPAPLGITYTDNEVLAALRLRNQPVDYHVYTAHYGDPERVVRIAAPNGETATVIAREYGIRFLGLDRAPVVRRDRDYA